MKTSSIAILPLLFALRGLAVPSANSLTAREDSNVLIDRNGFGEAPAPETITVTINQCRDLPSAYILDLSAIAPNDILGCWLFSGSGCTGRQSVRIDHRVENLRDQPYDFDNQAWSLNCTRIK